MTLSTEYDAEARARRQDAATEAAQHLHDARRGWKTDTDADEIEGLARALAGDLSVYTAAGVRTMRDRLLYLRAARGFVPTRVGGE
jgi:hypothetical protein